MTLLGQLEQVISTTPFNENIFMNLSQNFEEEEFRLI